MNRIIKFKAICKKTKQVYDVNAFSTYQGWIELLERDEEGVIKSMIKDGIGYYDIIEYIGRRDKNNKEIYEGDVLEGEDGFKYIVKWNEKEARFEVIAFDNTDRGLLPRKPIRISFLSSCKIIGNIYVDPNILKEVKE